MQDAYEFLLKRSTIEDAAVFHMHLHLEMALDWSDAGLSKFREVVDERIWVIVRKDDYRNYVHCLGVQRRKHAIAIVVKSKWATFECGKYDFACIPNPTFFVNCSILQQQTHKLSGNLQILLRAAVIPGGGLR